jgi:hypothetical protein
MPKEEELFDNEDFNLNSGSKRPMQPVQSLPEAISEEEAEETDSDDDDDDFVEVRAKRSKEEIEAERELELRYLGFTGEEGATNNGQMQIDLRFKENEDNAVVIEIMRGLYKELKKSYLVKINNWIKNFTMVKNASNDLKKVIELKNAVQVSLKKFEDLNIVPEVQKDRETKKSDDQKPGTSKSKCITQDEIKPSELTEEEKKRLEKIKIAPVIELSEMEYMAPITQRVETNHPIYQRKEPGEITQQQSDTTRLVKTTFVGKFEPVKWTCRAPMKNGKLCPRMDRVKCPLHGKVVARDETGKIVNEKDQIEFDALNKKLNKQKETPWLDEELIADINASSGKNLIRTNSTKKEADNKKRKKNGNLVNVAKAENTSRMRLEKRLLCPKNMNKIGSILDNIERRQNYEKFHHNFHYALQS